MAYQAAFPFPDDRNWRAHPTPAFAGVLVWPDDLAQEPVLAGLAAAVHEPPEVLPEAFEHGSQERLRAYALTASLLAMSRPDKAAPAGAVDSMGVPGLFCLWILNYLRYVGNVFSFRFLHLHYRDTTLTGAAANDVKRVTYSPVPEHTN
ncbi:hypothetical protein P8935_19245 [Telmatobacter sp. DSM 110680]|uniref:Uncharacterized protein n=1 Tax=Telmatobacter sp. DSM 110680 TaxID=3036704 RepID=A0AAU7DHZ9_9BACT